MKMFFKSIKKALKNKKGFALVQAAGLAAVAIALLSYMYTGFNTGFGEWMGGIDNSMTAIFEQSSVDGGAGGNGGSGGSGGTGEEPTPPEEPVVLSGGLYETGTTTLIKDWATLIADGDITVSGTTVTKGVTSMAGDLVIADGIDQIGSSAFSGCDNLTSVTIPDTVASIGKQAFYNCTSLTNVTIPGSVTSIGVEAFRSCTSLTSATIPESVTSISQSAFRSCTSLTSVTIPSSVTSIGETAFQNCTSLTSVTIPGSVTSIGNIAFHNCTSLTSVTIPEGVTSIGESAFQNCTSLTSVIIPGSVTKFVSYAFKDCTSLTSVYHMHTDAAPTWGSKAFYKSSGDKCTFYFKTETVAEAFEESGCYNSSKTTISPEYNWTAPEV